MNERVADLKWEFDFLARRFNETTDPVERYLLIAEVQVLNEELKALRTQFDEACAFSHHIKSRTLVSGR